MHFSFVLGSTGVINTLEFVKEKYISNGRKPLHFIKLEEQIQLQNEIIVVSGEWGGSGKYENFSKFLSLTESLNLDIKAQK